MYRVRFTLKDGMGRKVSEDDRERIEAALSETLEWLEGQDE
jgi:hypothetical protein